MQLSWSTFSWWVRAGFLSLIAYTVSLGVAALLCGREGLACAVFAHASRFVNTPVVLLTHRADEAIAKLMGFTNAHIVFESPELEKQQGYLFLLNLPVLVAYWFGLGVLVAWVARSVNGICKSRSVVSRRK